MNFRLTIFLLLTAFSSMLFSGCTNVESKNSESEEIVIDSGSKPVNVEVVITDADLQEKDSQISTAQESTQLAKRFLADKSEVETMIDGYGNKTETRYFREHLRLRCVILRTAVDGSQEVTVYGYGGDVKIFADLGDKALTASGDEIANTAELTATSANSDAPNFMKKRKNETPLKPLPSSAFQSSLPPINQPTETTNNGSENSSTQPSPEEDED